MCYVQQQQDILPPAPAQACAPSQPASAELSCTTHQSISGTALLLLLSTAACLALAVSRAVSLANDRTCITPQTDLKPTLQQTAPNRNRLHSLGILYHLHCKCPLRRTTAKSSGSLCTMVLARQGSSGCRCCCCCCCRLLLRTCSYEPALPGTSSAGWPEGGNAARQGTCSCCSQSACSNEHICHVYDCMDQLLCFARPHSPPKPPTPTPTSPAHRTQCA